MDIDEKEKGLIISRAHFNFCNEIYEIQHHSGRYLFYKHLLQATSWSEFDILRLSSMRGLSKQRDTCVGSA